MRKQRIVGISFEHIHMGDLLREAHEHPNAEIVGICDPDRTRMADAIKNFAIPDERVFDDIEHCIRRRGRTSPFFAPRRRGTPIASEAVAALGVDILLEKPFAASLADADRILAAVAKSGVRLAINWPLRWYPPHVTAKRLIDEGAIGDVIEVHFYDGNRGPLFHRADKVVVSDEEVRREKPTSWWYKRSAGGGSLLDYLGYGATLGTWFMKGEAPLEVTSVVDQPEGLEVDEHSITICRYRRGLSKLETRWGAFTDPWITQPQPKCGFVLVGTEGTIAELRLRTSCRDPDASASRDPKPARRHARGAVPQAGRIRAALQGEGRRVRRAARSRSLPHRSAHRRHRRAFGQGAAHAAVAAMSEPSQSDYALTTQTAAEAPAPELPYRPPMPRDRSIGIALVGAGGISAAHLDAYRAYGLNVLSICSRNLQRAQARRDAFFPEAVATDEFDKVLSDPRIAVLDITTHPDVRVDLMRRAFAAGKHVLSQKPFVEDLATGQALVEEAERRGVRLAVNQNGRWAPHLAYMREAVAAGLIGDVIGAHVAIRWNHGWIAGTAFEAVDDLVLWDFGIHWFDFLASVIGERPLSVHAAVARAASQTVRPPLLAEALIVFDGGQASLVLNGATQYGAERYDGDHRNARNGFEPRSRPRRSSPSNCIRKPASRGRRSRGPGSTTGLRERWGSCCARSRSVASRGTRRAAILLRSGFALPP